MVNFQCHNLNWGLPNLGFTIERTFLVRFKTRDKLSWVLGRITITNISLFQVHPRERVLHHGPERHDPQTDDPAEAPVLPLAALQVKLSVFRSTQSNDQHGKRGWCRLGELSVRSMSIKSGSWSATELVSQSLYVKFQSVLAVFCVCMIVTCFLLWSLLFISCLIWEIIGLIIYCRWCM